MIPEPKRLDREVHLSVNWFAAWPNGQVFEVTHCVIGEKYVVNLEKQSCTCNFWDLVGIPCCHVVCAIRYANGKFETYVPKYCSCISA